MIKQTDNQYVVLINIKTVNKIIKVGNYICTHICTL